MIITSHISINMRQTSTGTKAFHLTRTILFLHFMTELYHTEQCTTILGELDVALTRLCSDSLGEPVKVVKCPA